MQMMPATETVMCLPQLINNSKMYSILIVPALIPGTVLYSYNYENESLGQRGYTTQEFDENSEELVSVEEEIELKEDFGPEDLGVMEPIDSID